MIPNCVIYELKNNEIVCKECNIYYGVINGECKECKINKCVYCNGDVTRCKACRGGLKGTPSSCLGHNRCE